MNIQLVLKALKDHAKGEVRIHKEIFSERERPCGEASSRYDVDP